MKHVIALLVKELGPYKKVLWFYVFLSGVAALVEAFAPIVLGKTVDSAVSRSTLVIVATGALSWFAMRALANGLRTAIMAKGEVIGMEVGERFVNRTILAIVDKPLSHHNDAKQREHADSVMRFRFKLQNAIVNLVFDIFPALVALTFMLSVLTVRSPAIAGALTLSIVATVVFAIRIIPSRIRTLKASNKKQGEAADLAWDAVNNVLTVKSCVNEEFVAQALERKFNETMGVYKTMVRVYARMSFFENFIAVVGTSSAITIALMKLRSGVFTPGDFSAVVSYAFSAFGYVSAVTWQYRSVVEAAASYEDIRAILAIDSEDFVSGEVRDLSGAVALTGVKFGYRKDKAVLEDVSFTVPAGSRVALVGKSGEGKTTIIDLLGRYYEPTSGAITFDGVSATDINLRSLRSQMAYVPQETTLFHETLGYNIRFGKPDATEEEMFRAMRFAKLDAFVADLPEGLATMVGEKGLKLSGGQRQRVSLARAFLRDPKILILDEPTSQLDAETESDIQHSLEELMRGRTTFVIAHRLRTVKDADQILVLDGGRIVESGTHDQLAAKKDGLYLRLLRAQGMVTDSEG